MDEPPGRRRLPSLSEQVSGLDKSDQLPPTAFSLALLSQHTISVRDSLLGEPTEKPESETNADLGPLFTVGRRRVASGEADNGLLPTGVFPTYLKEKASRWKSDEDGPFKHRHL